MNLNQDVAFIAAGKDSLFVRFHEDCQTEEIDFDEKYNIYDILESLNANGKFYILANRYHRQKGLFLIELNENDPLYDNHKFLLTRYN